MTDAEFRQLKATMPWSEVNINTGRQTIIRIVDKHGQEVPLLTIVAFVTFISRHLTKKESAE